MTKKSVNKWLLFVMIFILSMLQFGLVFSFGALFPSILVTFDTDRATAATVQALLMGVTLCFSVMSGAVISRFGIHLVITVSGVIVSVGFASSFLVTNVRYLYLTIGVLAGTGTSLVYISFLSTISIVFQGKQKTLCLAIFNTNVSVAGLFYPYLLQWLDETYGLAGTFLILGGLQFNTVVVSVMTWRNRSYLTTDSRSENKKLTCNIIFENVKTLMSADYICLLVATAICVATLNGYLELAFDIAEWKGLNETEAKSTFFILNLFSCIMCVLPGLLLQHFDVDAFILLFVLSLSGITGSVLLYYCETYAVYAIGTAFLSGIVGLLSSSIITCVQLVRPDLVSVSIGLLETMFGLLTVGTGPFIGSIRDSSGSYDNVIVGIALVQALSAVMYLAFFIRRKLTKTFIQGHAV